MEQFLGEGDGDGCWMLDDRLRMIYDIVYCTVGLQLIGGIGRIERD